MLSGIKNADYNRIKREVVDRIIAIDPKIKEAVRNKHVDFFTKKVSPDAKQPQKETLANSVGMEPPSPKVTRSVKLPQS